MRISACLMLDAHWPRSWISSSDWYLHWKTGHEGTVQAEGLQRLLLMLRRGNILSSYFITYPRVPRKNRAADGVRVKHILNRAGRLRCYSCIRRRKATQDDSWLEIHHTHLITLSLSISSLLQPPASSSQQTQVGAVILQCVKSLDKC